MLPLAIHSCGQQSREMKYNISSRDYLERAYECLAENSEQHMFYAAFELRCGVESLMQQYLAVWVHISKKKEKGWKTAKLGGTIEKSFKLGDKIMRWAVHRKDSADTICVLYYTPVSAALRSKAQRLGNYLHAPKKFHEPSDIWWKEFSTLLDETASELSVANTGLLLGPALLKGSSKAVHMNVEVLPGTRSSFLIEQRGGVGKELKFSVDYLDKLPEPIELNAYVWRR